MTDLYTVLGVSRSADSAEIRKAYRALAKRYHPDRNPDPSCAEKFREITEAYKVLGNEERRALYNRYGDIALNPNFKGFEGAEESWNTSPFEGFEDFFNGFTSGFGGHGTQAYQGSAREEDYSQNGPARGNEYGTSDSYYTDNFGFGQGQRSTRKQTNARQSHSNYEPPQRGGDIEMTLSLELPEAILGCTKQIDVRRPSRWAKGSNAGMTQETVTLVVPSATQSATQLRVAEKGNPGTGGGIAGDLVVNVQVKSHPYLYREGSDVFLNVPLTLTEGIKGAQIAVPTLNGTVRIRVPAGVKPGQKLRLRDRGGPKPSGGTGDMYLILRVVPPDLSTDQAQAAAAALEEFYPADGLRSQMKL